MLTDPVVSVVLPTYNGSRYLEEAINSCINQTFSSWELIIVDDASTDDTQHIISKYTTLDSRIRSVRHESNKKLPAALNTGFSKAQGKFLTWTSDDNLYRPDALAVLVSYLETHLQTAVVYSDFTVVTDGGNIGKVIHVESPTSLNCYNCVGPCFLYRKEVQDSLIGYDETLFLAEDYDFWFRASLQFSLAPVHQDLYIYRNHSKSLTATRRHEIIEATAKLFLRNYIAKNRVSSESQAQGWTHLAWHCHANGMLSEARMYMFRAMKAAPKWVFARELQFIKEVFIIQPVKALKRFLVTNCILK